MKTYNPYKMFVGSFVPNWLMARPEISPGAKLCFARLAQYAGENGKCFPRQAVLAADLGTGDRNVRKYLNELEKHHLIKISRHGLNRPNTYHFLWHPWIQEPTTEEKKDAKQPLDETKKETSQAETAGPEQSFLSGPDPNLDPEIESGPEQSFHPARNNRSGLERNNRSRKENHIRESLKRGREPPKMFKTKKPIKKSPETRDPKTAIQNLLINMEAIEDEMAL